MDTDMRLFRRMTPPDGTERQTILQRLQAVEKRLDLLEHKPSQRILDDYTAQDRLRKPA